MISVDSFKQEVDDLANKYQTGADYGPDAFNRQLPTCVIDIVRTRLGLSEQYRPGQSAPAMAYELTQVITGELAMLKMADIYIPVSSQGIAELPTDFFYPSSIYTNFLNVTLKGKYNQAQKKNCGHVKQDACACVGTEQMSVDQLKMLNIKNAASYYTKQVSVTMYDDATFNQLRNNAIRVPSSEYPICRFNNAQLDIMPRDLMAIYMTYIRYPKTAKWNYTIDPTTLVSTYNPVGSQDIELPSSLTTPLMGLMLSRLGIKVREPELVQVGDKLNIAGK